MITTGDYIKDILNSLKIELSDARIEAEFLNYGITASVAYDSSLKVKADTMIYNLIPGMLARPDETMGDSSQKWDRGAIVKYYSILAGNLGLPNQLQDTTPPSISDKSYVW